MKKRRVSYILAIILIAVLSSVSLAAVPVEVTMGKETILKLKKPAQRVSIASPDTADVKLIAPDEIVITGRRTGVTSLIVWDKEGKTTFFDIEIKPPKAEETKLETLEKYIKDIVPNSDVKVQREGDTLILSGTVKNRVTCKRDKVPVVSRRGEIGDVIETQEKEICVEAITKIEQVTAVYFPNVKILNLVAIPEVDQVILEVIVAQIDKTKLKELGISWLFKGSSAEGTFPGFVASPGGTLGTALATSTVTSPSSGATSASTTPTAGIGPGLTGFDMGSLTPQIGAVVFKSGVAAFVRALDTKGYGKILAQPNLTVRTGEVGNFVAGSEVPIQEVIGTGSSATPSIIFKQVGIILSFKPEVLESGAIRLKVAPAEVSSIVGFQQFSGISAPIIDNRSVTTSVDLKDGESLVLAGLLSEEMKKNLSKIPILGDIPILGAFFRSSHDDLEKKELAFFITPKLIKPLAPGVRPELPGDKPLTPQEEGQFDWIPWPRSSEGSK